MKILGIDPGIGRTGWAIVEANKNSSASSINHGCIETFAKSNLGERLVEIVEALDEIINKYSPQVIAIEEMFFLKKSKTLLLAVQARGAAIYAAAKNKIPIYEYNPKKVKIALTGYGQADKAQIQRMIMTTLRLKECPTPDDTADALAIALCHYFSAARDGVASR